MLCTVCSTPSSKVCSKYHVTYYCSAKHQLEDWKAGHNDCCVHYPYQPNQSQACQTMFAWYKRVMSLAHTHVKQKEMVLFELITMLDVAETSEYLKSYQEIQWSLILRIVGLAIAIQLHKQPCVDMLGRIPSTFNKHVHASMKRQLAVLADNTNRLPIRLTQQIRSLKTLQKASSYFSNDLLNIVVDEKMNGLDVVANRDFQRGETVINEQPILVASLDIFGMCYHCGTMFDKKPTSCRNNCGFHYCNLECESRAFFGYHSPLCSASGFSQLQQMILSTAKQDPNSIGPLLYSLILIKFCGMQMLTSQHEPIWKKEPLCYFTSADSTTPIWNLRHMTLPYIVFSIFVLAILNDNKDFQCPKIIDASWFLQMMSYLWMNDFRCYDQLTIPLDLNGYPSRIHFARTPALFNHSCLPNIVDKGPNNFIACRDIAKGESLRISYANFPNKQILGEIYNFACDCELCDATPDKNSE